MRRLACLAAFFALSGSAFGQILVLDVSAAKPGAIVIIRSAQADNYHVVVLGTDGKATLQPITQTVVTVGVPNTSARPQAVASAPETSPSALPAPPAAGQIDPQLQSKLAISQALDGAGDLTTALCIQRAISAVATALDNKQLAADNGSRLGTSAVNIALTKAADMAFSVSGARITDLVKAGDYSTAAKGCAYLRLLEAGVKDAIADYERQRGNAVLDRIKFDAVKATERAVSELIKGQGLQ